jgi:hypothetical protein
MTKKLWLYFKIMGLVATPLILLILPTNFFDNKPSICLSRVFFDLECLGCGMGRGVMHLIHGDFEGAWGFHKLSFVVLPLLVYIWAKQIYFLYQNYLNSSKI